MRSLNQFILCNGKVPVSSAGYTIDPHDPSNWMSYDDAYTSASLLGRGIGFVFTSNDPYWFLDIDHCAIDGQWSPLAQQMFSTFGNACVEVSSSGEGIHMFGTGSVPVHSCKNKEYGMEFYTEGRFVLLNSDLTNGNYDFDYTQNIQWLVDSYFPPNEAEEIGWRNSPVSEWDGIEDDNSLLNKMLQHKSARSIFGGS